MWDKPGEMRQPRNVAFSSVAFPARNVRFMGFQSLFYTNHVSDYWGRDHVNAKGCHFKYMCPLLKFATCGGDRQPCLAPLLHPLPPLHRETWAPFEIIYFCPVVDVFRTRLCSIAVVKRRVQSRPILVHRVSYTSTLSSYRIGACTYFRCGDQASEYTCRANIDCLLYM